MAAVDSGIRSSRSASDIDWSSKVTNKGSGLPSRVVLHGVEGIGKTSFGASAPNPIFLQAKGETGLETLIDSGRLPETAHMPEIQTWSEFLSVLDWLAKNGSEHKCVVLDTLNGFERLCYEFVCQREYGGKWGNDGFSGYMRGYEVAQSDWREMLNRLDRIREKKIAILALCHTKVKTFKNPEGEDFDRYSPDMHDKAWGLTLKWADMVLFANFVTDATKSNGGKAKGKGGTDRIIYTSRTAAFDAKNRHGLPSEIDMKETGVDAWNEFQSKLKEARGAN